MIIARGERVKNVLLSMAVVIDHHDRLNDEHSYRRAAKLTQIAGWTAFGLPLVLDLFVSRGRT